MFRWVVKWLARQYLTRENIVKFVRDAGNRLLDKAAKDPGVCGRIGRSIEAAGNLMANIGRISADGKLTSEEVNEAVAATSFAVHEITDRELTDLVTWVLDKLLGR